MTVYVVHVAPDTPASFILGVFDTYKRADRAANENMNYSQPCNIVKIKMNKYNSYSDLAKSHNV